MSFPSLVAAHHVKVYINGMLLGYVQGIPQWNVDTDYRENREIDSNETRELMPGQTRVSGAMTILRGRDTGGVEGAGLVASGQRMLLQKYMTIELVDRLNDQVIFRAQRCQVTRQSWSITPKQLVVGSVVWTGITFDNEAQS